MSKDSTKRGDLQKNIMKSIIFRIDYQGVTDVNYIVEEFKKIFDGKFKSLEVTFHNTLDLELINLQEISDNLSVPVKELRKQEIVRFSQNTFGSDNLVFDISKYFTVLQVKCLDYKNIDEYLNFFSEFIDFLFDICQYIKFKRIGLRKIGSKLFFDRNDIYKDFEKKYFNFEFSEINYNSLRNRYYDVLHKDEKSPIINYIRLLESGKYFDNKTKQEIDAWQVHLDFDGYFSEQILLNLDFKKGMIKELLETTNHEHLFKLFKISVTEEFLKSNTYE